MRLTARVHRLARGGGCPVCSTSATQFTIDTNGRKLEPGAETAKYKQCPACGRQVLVWFTIGIDRAEGSNDVGDEECD